MKKTLCTALTSLFLFSSFATVSAETNPTTNLDEKTDKAITSITENIDAVVAPQPAIFGDYGVSIDAITGEVYYGKNEHEQALPASITKVLTAILADEYLDENDTITISELSALQEPSNSQLLLKEGETISKEDAIEMLLILSSNDVAFALAEEISGSVENFAVLMNERAAELGAQNSHFVTPNGLPNENHLTTAYDMAMIGKEWLNHPLILEIIQKRDALITVGEKEYTITPKHSIFTENPKAIGGKTGWTIASSNTLLEILQNGDQKVVTVVMKTTLENEYKDINLMSEYAFQNFKSKKFFEIGDTVLDFTVNKEEAQLVAVEPIFASYQTGETISNKIVWENKTNFVEGDTAAWLTLLDDSGEELKRFPLSINKSIHISDDAKSSLLGTDNPPINYTFLFIIFGCIIIIPLTAFWVLYRLTHKTNRKKNKRTSKSK